MPVEIVWQGTPAVTLNKNRQDTGNEYLFLVTPSEKGKVMTFDPFADAPTNDQFETNNDAFEITEDKKETRTVAVENTNEGKLTITLKGGSGFDAPWIVIHAENASDGLAQMQDPQLAELMDIVKRAGKHFGGGEDKPQAQSQAPQGKPGQPAGSTQPSNGEAPSCDHGQRIFRSGVGKNGKTWKAYFCPTPKGTPDQCDVEWVN